MAIRDTPFAPGTPCWVDLMTSDIEKAKSFYTALLGWTYDDSGPEYGDYSIASKDGRSVAGLMPNSTENGMPDVWTTYVATAAVEDSVGAAVAAGATVFMPATAVGEFGRMSMLGDSTGGVVGLWEAGSHTGFQRYNEPGSVTWDEYHSKDFAASTTFYETVFGWTWDVTGDSDDFRYSTANVNGDVVAGMMDSAAFLPAETPSHWTVYFSVENADDTIATAVKLGATVLRGPEDTPFGRIADLLDVTGANFKLHQVLEGNG